LGILPALPRLVGVQSEHADPVWRYYSEPPASRHYEAVPVRDSVAQAAMIGNPVSFPRVRLLVEKYLEEGGDFRMVQVTEQAIMDATLLANRHGNIACTQGGECLAGLLRARELGLVEKSEFSLLAATAHILKFSDFQKMYFENRFPPEYGVTPDLTLVNKPEPLLPESAKDLPPAEFTRRAALAVARRTGLTPVS
jgi:threonine synthase